MLSWEILRSTNGLTRVHWLEKVILAGWLFVLLLASHDWLTLCSIGMAALAVSWWGSRLPLGVLLRILSVPFLFLAMSLLTLLISLEFNPFWSLSWNLSPENLVRVRVVGLRALSGMLILQFLVISMPGPQLLYVLNRVGLPGAVVEIAGLMWRFVFLFAETLERLLRALTLRSCRTVPRVQHLGWVAGSLGVRVFVQARRLSWGMALRGESSWQRGAASWDSFSYVRMVFVALLCLFLAGVAIYRGGLTGG